MFSIEMFPAAQGDALWIEYGTNGDLHRVLVDGGTSPTYDHLRARLETIPSAERHFELMVVTHVDADHIEGMVRLLGDAAMQVQADDLWFNGWKHISDQLGPVQGEYLTALIERRECPWNAAFGGDAVVVDPGSPLPTHTLPGGLQLTVLSPTPDRLGDLAAVWKDEVEKAGLAPGVTAEAFEKLGHDARLRPPADLLGEIDVPASAATPFTTDGSEANGSSIVVLAEFDGVSCLLGADGVAEVLETTVPHLLTGRNVPSLELDALKLPHHGSKHNITKSLLEMMPADRYLFSTSGARFGHPDVEAVSRVLVHGKASSELLFNYRSEDNEQWDDAALQTKHSYTTVYPAEGTLGLRVDL